MNKRLRAALREFLLTHHRPGAIGTPAVRVGMFHMGRCGSTVLGNLLAAQGEVFWAGEIFEDLSRRYGDMARRSDAAASILRRSLAEPASLRAWVRRADYPRAYRVYGFETKYLREQHLGPDGLAMGVEMYVGLLGRLGFDRFIVLDRYNYLRMLASRAAGRATGTWHRRQASESPVAIQLHPAHMTWGNGRGTLCECLRNLDDERAGLGTALAGRQVLYLNYGEHIERDPQLAYRHVCEFLGLPARPAPVTLRRTNPFPLERIIADWKEVVAALRGTSWEWMLGGDELPPPV